MRTDIFKDDLHEEIMREYERVRNNNKSAQQKMKKHIYAHFPRVMEIDNSINNIALASCRKILEGRESAEAIAQKLKAETEMLVAERDKILKSAGLSPDCTEESYNCSKCKDTGWDNNNLCECYFTKMHRLMQKRANISSDKIHSFREFDDTLYSDVVDNLYGYSPRENAKAIYDTAVRYSKMEDDSSNQLLFYGSTGLGKTFTSECIANEFIKNGKDVFYASAPNIFTIFEDYKFGRNTTAEAKKLIDYIDSVDLLIIDDLGTEFRTQYIDSILFNIVNERIKYDKYMIISTNLDPDQMENTYSQRITSRIFGNFQPVLFFGDDIRTKTTRNI